MNTPKTLVPVKFVAIVYEDAAMALLDENAQGFCERLNALIEEREAAGHDFTPFKWKAFTPFKWKALDMPGNPLAALLAEPTRLPSLIGVGCAIKELERAVAWIDQNRGMDGDKTHECLEEVEKRVRLALAWLKKEKVPDAPVDLSVQEWAMISVALLYISETDMPDWTVTEREQCHQALLSLGHTLGKSGKLEAVMAEIVKRT